MDSEIDRADNEIHGLAVRAGSKVERIGRRETGAMARCEDGIVVRHNAPGAPRLGAGGGSGMVGSQVSG